MPVSVLLAQIPASELTEWQAYYNIEPFGEVRADSRAAIIASTVANTARDTKRKPKPFTPAEFMPKFGKRKPKSAADLLALARMANAALGGKELKNGDNW